MVLMGATVVQQCLRAGLLDELIINLVPVALGRGVRLLDDLEPADLELTAVIDAPGVTHLTYRVGTVALVDRGWLERLVA
jgi:dihydrofolate reductase